MIKRVLLNAIASKGKGWEHVSVSHFELKDKFDPPTWEDMCFVKSLFWDKGDTVVQFHPKESEYVNMHPGVLHLWRPTRRKIKLPPSDFV